jgi:hypothetical protein
MLCAKCKAPLRLLSLIRSEAIAKKTLVAVHLPAEVPGLHRNRRHTRLRAHRFVAKIPHSRRWRVSQDARRTMATAIKLREATYPSLSAAAA